MINFSGFNAHHSAWFVFLLFFDCLSSASSANVDGDCRMAYIHYRIEDDDMPFSGFKDVV